jgi:hypothetical protein
MIGPRIVGTLLIAPSLVLASCAGREPVDAGGGAGDGPALTVVEPADGSAVTSPVTFRVSVSGAEIGPPDTGLMHLHVYVGDGGDYAVVTEGSGEIAAPEGEQTLRFVLSEPNHSETDVSATVTVDVTSGTAGGGTTGGYSRYGGDDDKD